MSTLLRVLLLPILLFSLDAWAEFDCPRCRVPTSISDAAVANCEATLRLYHCSDYSRDADLGRYLRACSKRAICNEQEFSRQVREFIPGCTGITKAGMSQMASNIGACFGSADCMKQVPMETVRNIGRMGLGLVEGARKQLNTVYGLIFDYDNTMGAAQRGAHELHRRLQCLNTTYRDRITCELAGGVFAAATIGGAVAKTVVREAVTTTAQAARLSTRESVVAARESAGRGVRPAAIRQSRPVTKTARAATVAAAGAPAETAPATRVRPAPSVTAATVESRRDDFVRRLVGRQNTTLEQRQAFAELAAKTVSDGRTVFLDFQNSVLKYLNDRLGNKNVVTAMTNRRLEMTFERLQALKDRYPGMAEFSYDDFKSGRVAFRFSEGSVPPNFLDDVNKIMREAEQDYVVELERIGILPDDPSLITPRCWFAAGTGCTADQANAAARYNARTSARTGESSTNFWDPIVRTNLEGRLAQTDVLRSGTMKAYRDTPLVERLENGELIPSADVFEAYRTTKTTADFAAAIRERTGTTIAAQGAQSLRQYISMLDEWSTGLLVVNERQAVTFAGSRFNGVTVDVSGMGALNMRELARSLVGEREIDRALVRARQGERAATEIFNQNKAAIESAARTSLESRGLQVDIRISGDDIIVLPKNRGMSQADLAALHESIARSSSTSNVRISAVAPGVATADQVAVAGESLEKKVRGLTLGVVENPSRYTLMVVRDANGASRLQVAARSGTVPPDVERTFQQAFLRAQTP